jgi:predicted amidohydrolase YtcJ
VIAADLAFVHGSVGTMDDAGRWVQALAVRDGRIAAVGSDNDIRPLVGHRTEVVDLAGRMLLPGFQDAHMHPVSGGIELMRCDLTQVHTSAEYVRVIADYAQKHPQAPWILGGGWSMEAFPGGRPTADLIDAVVSDRPVCLPNRDHHSVWANSCALRLAGVDRHTPDPSGGRIERDADGRPTGALHEGAMDLVTRLIPSETLDEMIDGIRLAQRYLHGLGITAWHDAAVGARTFGLEHSLDAYLALASKGELTARVRGALWWDRARGVEQIDDLLAMRGRASAGRFDAGTVKLFLDGVCEVGTAAVIEPYLDEEGLPTANRGLTLIDPELLREYVVRLDAAGFQVHFHALGERAVRDALDAVEATRRENGANDLRHTMAHVQIVHPEDLPRFCSLGVVASVQPLWACLEPQMAELTIPFLGEERSSWQYPFGSMDRLGIRLAFGSDWPVSSADPLAGIHVAVNRVMPEAMSGARTAGREAFLPEERLSLASALRAFTRGSAYVNHLERDTGSLEVGRYADLVVLDRDLRSQPVDEIAEAKVDLTFVEGGCMFEAVHA